MMYNSDNKVEKENGKNMKIGNTELKYGLILAPMAGFSDSAMRTVCYECGAEYSVTEMVSAAAVIYGDKKTYKLAKISCGEGPVGLQIFGKDPSVMAEAAARLTEARENSRMPVAIDINMGCPVNKIYSNGEGSALMKNPRLIYDITRAVSGAVSLPVTVKLRLGVDRQHINAVECALAAEGGGAAAIAVHGRTRVEMYAGNADYSEIRKVKESLHIPLVANGDVTGYESYLKILRETGADAVMIGRGAIGDPFVFERIRAMVDGTAYSEPTFDERVGVAMRQLEISSLDKGEYTAVREARGQLAHYFKGFSGAAQLRGEINLAETRAQIEAAVAAFAERIDNHGI